MDEKLAPRSFYNAFEGSLEKVSRDTCRASAMYRKDSRSVASSGLVDLDCSLIELAEQLFLAWQSRRRRLAARAADRFQEEMWAHRVAQAPRGDSSVVGGRSFKRPSRA